MCQPKGSQRGEREISMETAVLNEGIVVDAQGRALPEIGIAIYVRKPREGSRSLSFQLPTKDMYFQTLLVRDVLDMGMAFDGDSVLVEVTPRTKVSKWEPNAGTPEENAAKTYRSAFYEAGDLEGPWSLSTALNGAQVALADWLIRVGFKAGYKVNVYFI